MILTQIIEHKELEVAQRKSEQPLSKIRAAAEGLPVKNKGAFLKAVSAEGINLIAEIKRRSPSKGLLRKDFNPVKIAVDYVTAGATALSVLTDEKFFGGSLSFIKEIKKDVGFGLPVLEKDFIIDEYQIYEAKYYGADAVLLITDILTEDELRRFRETAERLGMDALAEVRSQEDIEKAQKAGSRIIGINNRNLRYVPEGKAIVSESGIRTYKAVMRLKCLGVNAVLIGEAFMEAKDIVAKVREVMGTHAT
ncbi:MAG: indole-3-glycerol phosphate synthase TrpC [Candidatus Omnitrophica bacterium]|nr:indole-3-glycerol phosphate synthase TrpC [Candidatus Omnitrophota bacterium]